MKRIATERGFGHLSPTTRNAMLRNGFQNLEEATALLDEALRGLPWFGEKAIAEIRGVPYQRPVQKSHIQRRGRPLCGSDAVPAIFTPPVTCRHCNNIQGVDNGSRL